MTKNSFLDDICPNCGGEGVLPKANLYETSLDQMVDICEDCVECGGTGHSTNYRRVPVFLTQLPNRPLIELTSGKSKK